MPVGPRHSESLSTGMMQPWDIQQLRRGTGKAMGIWNQTGYWQCNTSKSCLGYTYPKAPKA